MVNFLLSLKKYAVVIAVVIFVVVIFASYKVAYYYKLKRIEQTMIYTESNFAYDLLKPDREFILPIKLNEISGIHYYKNNTIACIEDERGIIYLYDTEKNKINTTYKFDKDGDYEDIEIIDKTAYILKSNGNIYEVNNFRLNHAKITYHKTELSSKNDAEGLCYHSDLNCLLIACKGKAEFDDEKWKKSRLIFRFDLEKKELIEKPFMIIDIEEIEEIVNRSLPGERYHEVEFKPSGLAINPLDKNLYVIASVGKMLITFNTSNKITNIIQLDKDIFNQPEGICFNENGTLFISNEAKNRRATILQFNPK